MNLIKRTGLYLKGFTGALVGKSSHTSSQSHDTVKVSWFGGSSSFKTIPDNILMKEGFMGNSDVFSIITAIASEAVDVNFKVKVDGEEVDSGITYDLIHNTRSEHFSSKIEKALINLLSTGDVYIWKLGVDTMGFPTNIEVLRSSSMDIVTNSSNQIVRFDYRDSGKTIPYSPEEIIHIKYYNPKEDYCGNHKGLSKLQPGYKVLQASNNREMSAAHLFENLGVSGIISDKNGSLYDEEEEEALESSIIDRIKGAHKAGQFVVTSAEIEVHQMGMSAKDLELSKTGPQHLRRIAALFNVSSRPFNDPDGSTYNNMIVDDKNFFVKGVKKPLKKIILGLQVAMDEYEDGVEIVPDYSSIESLQPDQLKEIEKDSKKSDAVTKVLIDDKLTKPQKIFILVNIHKYEEEEATELVNNGREETQGNT